MTTTSHLNSSDRIAFQNQQRTFWLLGNQMHIIADHSDTDGRYDLIEARPPAGNQTPPHRHNRYSEQFYLLDGEVTIWLGKRKHVLHAGDTLMIPAGVAHVVAVTGDRPAHSLVIASPSGFARLIQQVGEPDTGAPPSEPTPADLERFAQSAVAAGDDLLGPPGTLPESE